MPIDPSIYQQIQTPKFNDPFKVLQDYQTQHLQQQQMQQQIAASQQDVAASQSQEAARQAAAGRQQRADTLNQQFNTLLSQGFTTDPTTGVETYDRATLRKLAYQSGLGDQFLAAT